MKLCTRIIEYAFYSLFFLVPLVFAGNTSELFEFNKMWVTFGITIIITAAWFCKMIIQRKINIQRTPLDIPLILFLISQIISTLLSLDMHVSIWGYYSRFNGGLLSTITYILLYYAFASNLTIKQVIKSLTVTLFSGLLVALWGLPSHFGYDPTCLIFRGSLDTACWTDAFKPTIRSFSTLGQPAWFAAYLAILLPISIAYTIQNKKQTQTKGKTLPMNQNWKPENRLLTNTIGNWKFCTYLLLSILFYMNLIFTDTRAGFMAFWIANAIFWIIIFYKKIFTNQTYLHYFVTTNLAFLIITFIFGGPIGPLSKLTLPQLISHTITKAHAQNTQPATQSNPQTPPKNPDINITDSGAIRLLVWKGAIDTWKANPLFGTGVETFAYAYYQHRPKEHNLTSEWDYLYNKAHNEYLNYLATTGIFGLGTYLAIILTFTFQFLKYVMKKNYAQSPASPHEKLKTENPSPNVGNLSIIALNTALFAAFISILISNFFGFSVVIINLYFFLIPAFFYILAQYLKQQPLPSSPIQNKKQTNKQINIFQWIFITAILILAGYLIIGLLQYWYADTAYALGSNLDKIGSYQEAYPQLLQAAKTIPSEPVYKDELSVNTAVLATALMNQKDTTNAAQFAQNALALNNQITTEHPNNVIFWKDRVRIFYSLSQADPQHQQAYLKEALAAMQKANDLAPTDAKIAYNLGILYGQTGNAQKATETLEQTVQLKSDYKDAYYALGLFYHDLASNHNVLGIASNSAQKQDETITNPQMEEKAVNTMQYILDHFSPNDKQTKDLLKTWKANENNKQ